MKAEVARSQLGDAVRACARVTSKGTGQHVHVAAGASAAGTESVIVSATDGAVTIYARLPAKVEAKGQVAVRHRDLAGALKNTPKAITLYGTLGTLGEKYLTVAGGETDTVLAGDAVRLPSFPGYGTYYGTYDAEVWAVAASGVAALESFADLDPRYGVVEIGGYADDIMLSAADPYRQACALIEGKPTEQFVRRVPRAAIEVLGRVLPTKGYLVDVHAGAGHMLFKAHNKAVVPGLEIILVTPCVDCAPVEILPEPPVAASARCNTGDLMTTAKGAKKAMGTSLRPLRLVMEHGKPIQATLDDYASVVIAQAFGRAEIAVNPAYLVDALTPAQSDQVTLGVGQDGSLSVVPEDDPFTHRIAPMQFA